MSVNVCFALPIPPHAECRCELLRGKLDSVPRIGDFISLQGKDGAPLIDLIVTRVTHEIEVDEENPRWSDSVFRQQLVLVELDHVNTLTALEARETGWVKRRNDAENKQ